MAKRRKHTIIAQEARLFELKGKAKRVPRNLYNTRNNRTKNVEEEP